MKSEELKIMWRGLRLTGQRSNSKLLSELNGCAQSGHFLSIMGPSGAGKSSLLSILTCRLRNDNSKLRIEGEFLLNGRPYDLSAFSSLAAYVQQDDVLLGALTVRETFLFQAQLKLWASPLHHQEQRCDALLRKLNLFECSQVLVGNSQFRKCISGGQKKRVAIGVELLSDPRVLVFDEPTSGLDSHNALRICRLLSRLAREEGKLIVATIHQPSSLIFREMDQLYLLRAGHCIYSGPASAIVPYMHSLGIQVDYPMNPADFFMLEISALKQHSGYLTPLNPQNCARLILPSYTFELQNSKYPQISKSESAPFSKQFLAIFERSFKCLYRTPSNQLNKLVTAFLIPALLGTLYHNIGSRVPAVFEQSFLFDLFSFLFMSNFFIFSMNVYDTALIFPAEKEIVCREAGSRLYSLPAYFLARVATEVAGALLPALLSGVLVYLAASLNLSLEHFGLFLGVYLMLALGGFLFGLMFGVLNKDSEKAITLLPLVLIPILIFGGLVVNMNDVPTYSSWLQYLSPLRHSFQIIVQNQLLSPEFQSFEGLELPSKYGLEGDAVVSAVALAGLVGLYLVLGLLFLVMVKRNL